MGSAPSKRDSENKDFKQLENEAIRNAFPIGLEDDRAKELKYRLHMCLVKNDWYFTGGGIILGGILAFFFKSSRPIGVAAVLSPAADWAYGRHVCKECGDEYNEYRRQLTQQYREQAEALRRQIRGEEPEGAKD